VSSTAPPPPKEAAFFTAIRGWGITRGRSAVFGGVADGVGERVGLAHGPARLLLVLAGIMLTGITLLAYAAAWALLPDRNGNIVIQNFGRGVTNVGALIGIGLFAAGGVFNLNDGWWGPGDNFGWDSGEVSGFGHFDGALSAFFSLLAVGFSLLVLGAIVFTVVYLIRRSNRNSAATPNPTAGHPTQPGNGTEPETMPREGSPAPGDTKSGEAPAAEHSDFARTAVPPAAQNPGYPEPWQAAILPAARVSTASAGAASGVPNSTGATPVPPAPPRPPVRRVPGPSRRFYLLTASWVLISGAIIAATGRLDRLAVAPGLAWLALFTVGFGLILAIISAVGRKLGFLGFLSVPLLLVGLLVSVNSGELGRAFDQVEVTFQTGSSDYWGDGVHYDEFGNVLEDEGTSVLGPTATDPTAAFADDFRQIYFAPQCYDWDSAQTETWTDAESAGIAAESGSLARLTYASLATDTEVDVIAERTILTIPAGTNLVLRADSNAQSTIDWESRGLQCEFWEGGQSNLSLINPGAPTLTLKVLDDAYANTIEIHETAPVEPDPASDAEPTAGPEQTATPQPTATTEENQS